MTLFDRDDASGFVLIKTSFYKREEYKSPEGAEALLRILQRTQKSIIPNQPCYGRDGFLEYL